VGREREVAEVTESVGAVAVTTLVGPGGVGKTALATTVAAATAEQFSGGVFVVWLGSLQSPELVVAEVAAQVGLTRSGGHSYEDALTEWLTDRDVLLVLDNCEHVVAAVADLVDALTARLPRLRVLATSREPLWVGLPRCTRLRKNRHASGEGLPSWALHGGKGGTIMRDRTRRALFAVLATAAFVGCVGETEDGTDNLSVRRGALTDPTAVMGFESASYWSTTGGSLATSTTHTQGSSSLAVTEQGYIELTSVALPTVSAVGPDLAFDIQLPSPQPNPYWYGQVQMFVSVPSQSLYNVFLGAVELTGLPLQTFKTVKFVVDAATQTKLRASYSDLKWKVVLNTPSGTARKYLIDNLRFLNSSEMAWPNSVSKTTSDPWIVQHHQEITVMRPRVMALNFVNPRSMADMSNLMGSITAGTREATRPKGAENPSATTFLDYQVAYSVDLRDAAPPANWPYNNSTKYPRQNPVQGRYGFDYSQLFTQAFADLYHIPDPQNPSHNLTLCELSARGLVHEVWMYADADKPEPFGSAAEMLGIQPFYDSNGNRLGTSMNRCAGNGCFDAEDNIPSSCTNTLRIGFVNNTRGVGCYLESLGHTWENIGSGGDVPYLTNYFPEFAGFDLNTRYGLPFGSWYSCQYGVPCVAFPTDHSVNYQNVQDPNNPSNLLSGSINPYTPVCGNAHFPPNGRQQYDTVNTQNVQSSCNGYRTNGGPGHGDPTSAINSNNWSNYGNLAPDCTGAWAVYWWQRYPAVGTTAKDASGATMKNWWPFFFY